MHTSRLPRRDEFITCRSQACLITRNEKGKKLGDWHRRQLRCFGSWPDSNINRGNFDPHLKMACERSNWLLLTESRLPCSEWFTMNSDDLIRDCAGCNWPNI